MAIDDADDEQLDAGGQYKISRMDIELKERQFMLDEIEYYKAIKTKAKKNIHMEDKAFRFFG